MKFRREWWYVVGLAVIIVFLIIILSKSNLLASPRADRFGNSDLESFLKSQRAVRVDDIGDLRKVGGAFRGVSGELFGILDSSRGVNG